MTFFRILRTPRDIIRGQAFEGEKRADLVMVGFIKDGQHADSRPLTFERKEEAEESARIGNETDPYYTFAVQEVLIDK